MALLLFMTLAAWSMGSAVGSSPDEDYVLTSIWCGTEGNPPYCRKDPDRANSMIVPMMVAEPSKCYLSQGQAQSAGCQIAIKELETTTSNYNTINYPKAYFNVTRQLVSPFVEASVVKIRLLNSLMAVALIFISASLIKNFKIDTFLSWLAVVSPGTFYYIASVNTSSWTIVGVTCFVFSALAIIQNQKNALIQSFAAVCMLCSIFFAAGSRFEGKYFLLLFTLAIVSSTIFQQKLVDTKSLMISAIFWTLFLLLFFIGRDIASSHLVSFELLRDSRLKWVALVLSGSLALTKHARQLLQFKRKTIIFGGLVIAGLFLVYDRTSRAFIRIDILNDSRSQVDEGIITTANNLLINNFLNLPRFVMGFFGSWGLGWFELEMTHTVWLLTLQAFLLTTVFALRKSNYADKAIFVFIVAIMCVAILYANQQTFTPIGQVIQPRYFLPFFLGIVIIAAANKTERYPNSLVITVAILATISNSIALRDTIRRYTTGQDVFISKSLNDPIEWWWQFGPKPETVWLIGTLAFAALWALLIYDRNKNEVDAPKSPTPELAN